MYRFREWKPVSWFRVVAGVVIGAILLSYAAFLFFEHKAGRSLIEWGPRTLVFTVVLASVGITLGLLSRSRFVREWIFELVLLALLVVLLLALVGKPPWGSSEFLILLGHSLIGVVIIRCLTPFRLAVTILTGGLALVVFLFMPKGQNTFRLFWPRWFSRAGRVSVREAYLAGLDEPTRKHP